jgi:hypothetical protein
MLVDIQHDRIDRRYIPEGRSHKVTVVMETEIYTTKINHVEFWVWLPHTAGEPDWQTNILNVDPSYPTGSHSGPSYDQDGWYVCEINQVQSLNFSSSDVFTLEFTVEVPASFPPIPIGELDEFMKFYGIVSGKFGEGQMAWASNAREHPMRATFTTEPYIYPADTPVTFDNLDESGVKVTFDVSPKIVQIPFEMEQKWHIEAEFEVLENNKVNWVEFMPHLVSAMFETPVIGGFFDPEGGWFPENKKVTIIDSEGSHQLEIDPWDSGYDFSPYFDKYLIYMGLIDASIHWVDEDIDEPFYDNDYFITAYSGHVELTDDSFFEKGDKIRFEFDIISPAMSPGSTPHELVKTSFMTNCDTLRWERAMYERRYSIYFELGPGFMIPEVPYGSLTVLISSLIALVIARAITPDLLESVLRTQAKP